MTVGGGQEPGDILQGCREGQEIRLAEAKMMFTEGNPEIRTLRCSNPQR